MNQRLAHIDWLVIAVYLLATLGIGIYYYAKNRNQKDFFLGGGQMAPFVLGLSIFSTFVSAISYMATPGEMIKHGPVIFLGFISYPLVYYVVGWLIIPRLKRFQVTSAYEILEIKLGTPVRVLASALFLILRLLWIATIIYVTIYIVVLPVLGIPSSYFLWFGVVLMLITIVYTSLGGLKAVVLTDAIQAIILFFGAILVIVVVSIHFGSFTSWIPQQPLPQWGEIKWGIDPRSRSSVGAAILMFFVYWVATAGGDQMTIQRFLATKDIASARKTFRVSLIADGMGMVLLGLVGLALLAFFNDQLHLLPANVPVNEQADKLFPEFIVVGLPAGLSGILIAAVLAAAMSSLSSGINSCASVVTEDFLRRFGIGKIKPAGELRQVRILSAVIGVLTLLLSMAFPYVKGNLYDLSIRVVNLLMSPLFVLLFMALFVPFATARGALIGGCISIIVAVAIAFFGLLGINVFFITITSLLSGIITGVIGSYIDHKVFGNMNIAAHRRLRANK